MSIGEDQVECPLCMEPLEIDDINFFPCTCGYQICRFCWHRIRTDENGLCPACRKQYPEDPAEFKPLTEDELQRIRKERKQKDLQRKQKAAENRKHLANVRVVQKNLVFVVGLSQRLAETEVLKKHEYFGKFGKIHKVVINQSTSYAGSQGPSASAYVTYNKPEDALKAILAVNNVHIDGRTLKASLGTTKYCSHFLKGTQCMKSDCMYLHELGEEAASFTKDEMQMGKHQEYEQKLLEQYLNSQNVANSQQHQQITNNNNKQQQNNRRKNSSPPLVEQIQASQQIIHPPPNTTNNDAWPSLENGPSGKIEIIPNGNSKAMQPSPPPPPPPSHNQSNRVSVTNGQTRMPNTHKSRTISENETLSSSSLPNTELIKDMSQPELRPNNISDVISNTTVPLSGPQLTSQSIGPIGSTRRSLVLDNGADSLSFFSGTGFSGNRKAKLPLPSPPTEMSEQIPSTEIPETIPVSTTTDWQAAFGFGSKTKEKEDDDLGFDPWDESSKGLADLIQKENGYLNNHRLMNFNNQHMLSGQHMSNTQSQPRPPLPHNLPPGFSLSHIQQQQLQRQPFLRHDVPANKLTQGFMPFSQNCAPNFQNTYNENTVPDNTSFRSKEFIPNNSHGESFSMKDWQEGLRALLPPNINVSFGAAPQQPLNTANRSPKSPQSHKSSFLTENQSQLLKSFPQFSEYENPLQNHRLPFVQQFPLRSAGWPQQTHNPPPGFQSQQIRPPTHPEPHTIAEGLQ